MNTTRTGSGEMRGKGAQSGRALRDGKAERRGQSIWKKGNESDRDRAFDAVMERGIRQESGRRKQREGLWKSEPRQ